MLYLSPSSKRRTTRRHQQGVALIEVMVSLLIFSLGVLGLVAMQGKAITYTVDAENRSRAALLASEIVASMWLEGTNFPSQTTQTAWKGRVADATVSGLPNATADVQHPDANGVTKVTITWRAPSKTGTENSSYFTQVVIP
jgi:type IV pilus assembly protein PilV